MKKLVLIGAATVFAAGSALRAADTPMKPKPPAHKMGAPAGKMAMSTPAEMTWGDPPPVFAPGARSCAAERRGSLPAAPLSAQVQGTTMTTATTGGSDP